MPNWCYNSLTLSHADPDKVQRLHDAITKDKQFFEYVLPTPEGFLDDDRWYDWRITNWGTKWDADLDGLADTLSQDESSLSLSFDTAWSPPIGVYQKLIDVRHCRRNQHE